MAETPDLASPVSSPGPGLIPDVAFQSEKLLLGISVLNYNNAPDTIDCLNALLAADDKHLAAIVVVDNASTDNSLDVLSDWFAGRGLGPATKFGNSGPPLLGGELRLVASDHNGGYGAGNNIALETLAGSNPDWYWVLNNDASIGVDDYRLLVQHLKDHRDRAAIIGMRIHIPGTAPARDMIAGGRLSRFSGRTLPLLPDDLPPCPTDPFHLDYISGASMLISHEVYRRCGALVEDHFLFWEEIDYANRAINRGCSLIGLEDVTVLHKQGQVSGAGLSNKLPSAFFYSSRAAMIYFLRYEPWYVPIAAAARTGLSLQLLVVRLRPGCALAVLKGIFEGLAYGLRSGRPKVAA